MIICDICRCQVFVPDGLLCNKYGQFCKNGSEMAIFAYVMGCAGTEPIDTSPRIPDKVWERLKIIAIRSRNMFKNLSDELYAIVFAWVIIMIIAGAILI